MCIDMAIKLAQIEYPNPEYQQVQQRKRPAPSITRLAPSITNAAPSISERAPSEQICAAILDICRGRLLALPVFAELLDRKAAPLRTHSLH